MAALAASPSPATSPAAPSTRPTDPDGVALLGKIADPAISESSGIVASRRYPGVFWTHNDSGNPPVIYAVKADGALIRAYPVKAPSCRDWEDIAIDEAGHLYLGEIGNNGARFRQIAVYRLDEPDPTAALPPKQKPPTVLVDRAWQLRFPNARPFDCESLFVYDGQGYVCSKLFTGQQAGLYRFPLVEHQPRPATLQWLTSLPIRWPVTGADISPDGQRLAIVTNDGPYLFQINGDPASAGQRIPTHISYLHPHLEAICFVPPASIPNGLLPDGLLATCETREMLWFHGQQFAHPPAKQSE